MFAMRVARRAVGLLPRACVRLPGALGSSPLSMTAAMPRTDATTVATAAGHLTAVSTGRGKSSRASGGGGGGGQASCSISFLDAGISAELLDDARDVLAEFRDRPTDVQCASIPRMLAGENLIIGSETGSGKTLAYTLPLFDMLRAEDQLSGRCVPHRPRAVVVLPSRELALQVRCGGEVKRCFCWLARGGGGCCCVGGGGGSGGGGDGGGGGGCDACTANSHSSYHRLCVGLL
jgi:hypothetical protein